MRFCPSVALVRYSAGLDMERMLAASRAVPKDFIEKDSWKWR